MKVFTKQGPRLPALIGVLAFALYALTAGPSIVEFFDDSLEFQLVGPTLGIAHPTGYPLYTLLGGLWSRALLPLGNWAWRMNVLSALFAAIAVALLFATTRRMVTWSDGRPNQWAGLAAVLTFGLGPLWWRQATVAEVYTLHMALVAAILHTAIGINRTVTGGVPAQSPAFVRRMTWLCLWIGLGLAHHRTTVLVLPGLAVYLLWSVSGVWRPHRAWLGWAAALFGPLLLYLYIPVRAAMGVRDLNASYVNTWSGFWAHVTASGYVGFFNSSEPTSASNGRAWIEVARIEISALGLILALVGLSWLTDRRGRAAKAWIFVLLVLVVNLLFALLYRVDDAQVFLLPVFFCAAIFVGGGVGIIGRVFGQMGVMPAISQALLVMALTISIVLRGPFTDRSQDWAAHDQAVAMASTAFPAESRVVGLEGEMTALKYMQQTAGLGLAATPVVADDPVRRQQIVEELMGAGMPVFLTRELAGIETRYSFTSAGPLVRVWPRGQTRTAEPQQPLDVRFANDKMAIEGVDLALAARAGGPALEVVYYWRPVAPVDQDFKLSLRVLDAAGRALTNEAGDPLVVDAYPVRQAALTRHWLPGERIADAHFVAIPAQRLAEAAILETVVYDAATVAEAARWQVDLRGLTQRD